jgi:hypothetical protein
MGTNGPTGRDGTRSIVIANARESEPVVHRPIEATMRVRSSFERARDLLLHEPARMFGASSVVSKRDYVVDLSTGKGDGGAIHKKVQLEIIGVHTGRVSARWDLTWTALDHPRLFPVFHGSLTLWSGAETTIRLTGTYTPPMGLIGRFGDGVIAHRIARGSLEGYLTGIGDRIDQDLRRRRSRRDRDLGPLREVTNAS